MKKIFFAVCSILIVILLSCSKTNTDSINVYAYDSFCTPWGAGRIISQDFEKETGIHVNLISCGSESELNSRLKLENTKCKADVVIGISDISESDSTFFIEFTPDCKSDLIDYDEQKNLIPFDWGIITFNASESIEEYPHSLTELENPKWKDKFILIDPRTSAVGKALLVWTVKALGEERAMVWWENAGKNALTTAGSWSTAYGLFTENEAPIVVSYSTSPVYHILTDDSFNTKALSFDDGHIYTVEYLGIPATGKNKEKAGLFCNYLLTKGQKAIAETNTMLPANKTAELDPAFDKSRTFNLIASDSEFSSGYMDHLLDKWTEVMTR